MDSVYDEESLISTDGRFMSGFACPIIALCGVVVCAIAESFSVAPALSSIRAELLGICRMEASSGIASRISSRVTNSPNRGSRSKTPIWSLFSCEMRTPSLTSASVHKYPYTGCGMHEVLPIWSFLNCFFLDLYRRFSSFLVG